MRPLAAGPLAALTTTAIFTFASASPTCKCAATWYETTWHNPSTWRNVKTFGAIGDGIHDDTQALRAAINFNQTTVGEKQHFVVYLPPGTYVVSDTIVLWKGTHLHGMQGRACCRPVIRLSDNQSAFSGPLLKPVLASTNGWGIRPESNDWCTDNSTLGGSSNNNFQTQVQHVTLALGTGNAGAVGILWKVAQQTSIRMVDIDARGAAIGLDAGGSRDYADDPNCAWSLRGRYPSQSGGGSIESVAITGGRTGLRGTGSQWLFRSVRVDDSRSSGIEINAVWSFVFLDLEVTNCPVAVNFTGGMALSIVDSRLRHFPATNSGHIAPAAIITRGSGIMLRNVSTDNTVHDMIDTGRQQVPAGIGQSWYNGNAFSAKQGLPDAGEPPSADTIASRHLWPVPSLTLSGDVANVHDFGALGDGVHDDTRALQAAIDTGKTVFVPTGSYLCNNTIHLPSGTKVLGEQFPMIFLASNTSGFTDVTAPKALLETVDDPAGVVQLVGVHVSSAGFAARQQGNAGAILISWRCGGVGAGIWDTMLASSAVLWSHVRVTGGGGGVLDNVWSPGATNQFGFSAANTTRPLSMYATMFEHHTVVAYNVERCQNIHFLVMQTENSPLALNITASSAIEVFGALFTDWAEGRPSLTTLQDSEHTSIHGLAAFNTSNLLLSTDPPWRVPAGLVPRGGQGWDTAILIDIP